MSSFKWQISEAVDEPATEQHQGGAVALLDVNAVSTTPAWLVEEANSALQMKPLPGGPLELAPMDASAKVAGGDDAKSWGISKGAINFAFVFLVLIFGTIILLVAVHDKNAGNLTFAKLVEELGLLLAGLAGGAIWRLRR